MDGISTSGPKEEVTLRVVVRMPPQHIIKGVRNFGGGVALSFLPKEVWAPRTPEPTVLSSQGLLRSPLLGAVCPGLMCVYLGLTGLEAAGVLPGVQQGQRES